MAGKERDFDQLDQFVYGIPFPQRDPAVAAFVQRGRLLDSHKELKLAIRQSGAEVVQSVRSGAITRDDAARELTGRLGQAFDRFEAVQRGLQSEVKGLGVGIERNTEVTEAGFRSLSETIVKTASASTGTLLESQERLRRGLGLIHEQGERRDEILHYLSERILKLAAIERQGFDTLSTGINALTEEVFTGLMRITAEQHLTRQQLARKLRKVGHVLEQGFDAVIQRLDSIAIASEKVRETEIREAYAIAYRLFKAGNIPGAIQVLERTEPDTHPFAAIHLLLGHLYSEIGQQERAAYYVGWARKHSEMEGDTSILEESTLFLARLLVYSGDLEGSIALMGSLISDSRHTPHLRDIQGYYAMIQHARGEPSEAIAHTIYQLIVNPVSLSEILEAEYLHEIISEEFTRFWHSQFDLIFERQITFDPANPHFAYLALSFLSWARLCQPVYAAELLRIALRKWKENDRPLTREDIEREFHSLFPNEFESHYISEVLITLLPEKEFYWLYS